MTTSYAYNPRGFLADLKTTAPQASGGAVLSEFGGTVGTLAAMTYDAVGNRTKMTGVLTGVGGFQMLGNGSSSSQYTYDTANELTQEQTTEPGNGSYTNSYAYDGAQNRTSQNGQSIGHNADNQLSASGAYAYDGNGNPTTYSTPLTFGAVAATFDPENRMTSYAGSQLTATYDSDGLRASKTNSSGTTYYVYDEQDRPVVELNAGGSVAYVNTFGDNGLLSRYGVSAGASSFYAFDPQGSAVDVMQGAATASYSYTAFGLLARGATPSTPWQFGAQWGYDTDQETGLILCTHRYYDPYTGRFVNRDPHEYDGGRNLYNYTKNDPVNAVDSDGFSPIMPTCSSSQKTVIKRQFADVCRIRIGLLANLELQQCPRRRCTNLRIECNKADEGDCPRGSGYTWRVPGYETNTIHLCPDLFAPDYWAHGMKNPGFPANGRCVGEAILHEMIHSCKDIGCPNSDSESPDHPHGDTDFMAQSAYNPGTPPCPQ